MRNTEATLVADKYTHDKHLWAGDRADFVAHAADPGPPAGNQNRPGPLAARFASLASALLTASTVADVLEQVVDAAHRPIPGADLQEKLVRGETAAAPGAGDDDRLVSVELPSFAAEQRGDKD